jgi:hypothetical protein
VSERKLLLVTLNPTKINLKPSKDTAVTESKVAEKPILDQANRGQKT